MNVTHVHVRVVDLRAAAQWFASILHLQPLQETSDSCVYAFQNVKFVVDQSDQNSPVILAVQSDNCDEDYQRLLDAGAVGVSPPKNYSTGSRAALVQGPGEMKLELDQVL